MPPPIPAARASEGGARDTAIAARNAVTLGASLIATWSVALLVRLYLPRHLGPEIFGVFNFADAFAATSFIVLGMGMDTYIQKVIPVRPEHASDFFGGFVVVRLLAGAAVFALMALLMTLAHRPPAVQRVVFVFGAAQLLVSLNGSLAALLHASRSVGGLALVNVASKLLWGAGVAVALAAELGLVGLALAFLASEALRMVALATLARRKLGLRLRFDLAAVKLVLVASFPFYVNQVANTVYARVDVSMLAVLAGDREVGWYGTASNLASLALLVSPLVGWVLMPLLSRAAARSTPELFELLRRAIEVVLLAVLPVSLLMGLGADVWIPALFGPSFLPATLSLRLLAPLFVFTYFAMITATCLLLLGRAWTVALISLVALALNPALNLLLVPRLARALGPGGAGAGAAIALLLTEMGVTIALAVAVGRQAFDRASVLAIGKAVLCCGAVIAADRALRPLGGARLAVDAGLYVALLFATSAVKPSALVRLARLLLDHSRHHAKP